MTRRSGRLKKLENNQNCWYCGDPAEDVDHVIPVSRGGPNKKTNLVPACRPCNNSKGAMTVEEFREYIKLKALKHSTKHTVLKIAPFEFKFFGERSFDGLVIN